MIMNDVGMKSFKEVFTQYKETVLRDFNIDDIDVDTLVYEMVKQNWIQIEMHLGTDLIGHMMANVEGDNIEVHIFVKPEFRRSPDVIIGQTLQQIAIVFGNNTFTTQVDSKKNHIGKTLTKVGFEEVERDDELVYYIMEVKK